MFSNKIKTLRQKADMTQERLAEILSVSPQAVSRWETGSAMPDISLLPPIANLFGVTTDFLLDVDIANNQKRISDICSEASGAACGDWSYSDYQKAISILRDGLKLYPNSWQLKMQLAEYLSYHATTEEQRIDNLREANRIFEDVLANSDSFEYQYRAIARICRLARETGNLERAMKLAEKLPTLTQSKEELQLCLYDGEALDSACKDYLNVLYACLTEALKKWARGKSAETILSCYRKACAIGELLYDNDDFIRSEYFWFGQVDWAKLLALAGDYENSLRCLEKELENEIHTVESCFTEISPLVPDYIVRECTGNSKEDVAMRITGKTKQILQSMDDDFPINFVNDPRLMSLKEKMQAFIQKNV